jgi:hypothetical protein
MRAEADPLNSTDRRGRWSDAAKTETAARGGPQHPANGQKPRRWLEPLSSHFPMYYIWEIGKVAVPTDFTARRALAHTVSRALNEPTQDLLPRPLGTPRYLRYASDMESELLISPTPRPPDRSTPRRGGPPRPRSAPRLRNSERLNVYIVCTRLPRHVTGLHSNRRDVFCAGRRTVEMRRA